MITYKPFFETLKKKGISQYDLIEKYDISSSLLNRLKHDNYINMSTVERLCVILDCKVEEVVEVVDEHKISKEDQ